jgi:cyclopropane-fatty-acyl-phospholipid synthase
VRRWATVFNREWPTIAQLGFDERFRRMWNYYLSYCEAGFLTKHIDVAQFQLVRGRDS